MLEFAEAHNSHRETLFVEVILPLAIAINYTYRVPFEMNSQVAVGKRVVVQFGKSKMYTAIIASFGKYSLKLMCPKSTQYYGQHTKKRSGDNNLFVHFA